MSTKKKQPRDLNRLAFSITQEVTEDERVPLDQIHEEVQKNIHAMELGRLGGLKGGKARMEILTSEERSELARKAARARWGKK